LITNTNKTKALKLTLDIRAILPGDHVCDLSLEQPLKEVPSQLEMKLNPSEVKILYQKS
jgi:hypothetical protein